MQVDWLVMIGSGPLAVMLLGIAIVGMGLRGRRIDEHPLCRCCGFDLIGKPPDSLVCSECGAELGRKRAIRIGHRQRRAWAILLGVAISMPGIVGLGVLGWLTFQQIDWYQHKPTWWLLRETGYANATTRDNALTELIARDGRKELSETQTVMAVERILAIQGDSTLPWKPAWGVFVEGLLLSDRLDKERWEKYCCQSSSFRFEARRRLRRGDPLPLRLTSAPSTRTGTLFIRPVALDEVQIGPVRLTEAELTTRLTPSPDDELRRVVVTRGQRLASSQRHPIEDFLAHSRAFLLAEPSINSLSNGKHRISVQYRVAASVVAMPAPGTLFSTAPVVDTHFVERVEQMIDLVDAGTPAVDLVTPQELQDGVAKSISIDAIYADRRPTHQTVDFALRITSPPMPLSFRVFLRHGGTEWDCGSIVCPKGSTVTRTFSLRDDNLLASQASIILRPDVEAPHTSIDIEQVWGGSFSIVEVPVEPLWKKPAGAR